MTLFSSRDFDPQSFGHVMAQLATQVNLEKGTTLLVSRHYDKESIPLMLKRIVDAVNTHYSGSIIASRHYDDQFIASVLKRCVDKVNGDEEEGGSAPNWVPANAKIYIDLVNDRAWTEADGEVTIDTLLGADANTVNGWDTSEYDPAKLTADGYAFGGGGLPIAFIGTALAKVLAGASIRETYKQPSAVGPAFTTVALLSADGNDALEWYTQNQGYAFDSYGGSLFVDDLPSVINTGLGAVNAVAATITGSRFELAANGSDVVSGVVASDDRPVGNPLVAAVIFGATIQSITIYDALPSTAGLSALSATGVTNTAPTGISITWRGYLDTISPTHASIASLGTDQQFADISSMVDAEGNPGVFTLVDDLAGKIAFFSEGSAILVATANIPTGDNNFTLRATDPGGLYVEQQFTITVTA